MRKQLLALCWLLLPAAPSLQAQVTQYQYYFDKDMNKVSLSNAAFNGTGVYEDSLFKLTLHNLENNGLVLTEHFTDSTLKIANGLFESFFANAATDSTGTFAKGQQEGLWLKYDARRHVVDSAVYRQGVKIKEVKINYNDSGRLLVAERYDYDEGRTSIDHYDENGKITSALMPSGKQNMIAKKPDVEASFPGGNAAWTRYVSDVLNKNLNRMDASDMGTCVIKFIVDEEGNVSNAEAVTMKNSMLAKLMVRAVMKGPKWIPALQGGKPVKAYRLQPATLGLK